jgi:pSer/pThr/pTyr-binding forkhead associated (FHA) protein
MKGNSPPAPPGKRNLALYVEGEERLLEDGEYILGRSPSCDIVIDDMLASRVHAKLSVSQGTVILRDIGSSNGVYVNSARIDMPTPLRDGDRILIGTKEISVFAVRAVMTRQPPNTQDVAGAKAPSVSAARARTDASRLAAAPSVPAMPVAAESPAPGPRAESIERSSRDMPRTEKTDAFTQLGLLARRMIESGRMDGAVRVLSEHMRNVLEGARDGRVVPPDVLVAASSFAMEFAEAQLESKWVDYVIELHMNVRKPLSADLIDALCRLRRKNVRCDRDMLLFYKAALQREEPNLPLSQRVLCARIFSLDESG